MPPLDIPETEWELVQQVASSVQQSFAPIKMRAESGDEHSQGMYFLMLGFMVLLNAVQNHTDNTEDDSPKIIL